MEIKFYIDPENNLLHIYKHNIDEKEAAEAEFWIRYPNYNPKDGIRGFIMENWNLYTSGDGKP